MEAFEAWYAPMKDERFCQFAGTEHEVVDRWVAAEVPGYAKWSATPSILTLRVTA